MKQYLKIEEEEKDVEQRFKWNNTLAQNWEIDGLFI